MRAQFVPPDQSADGVGAGIAELDDRDHRQQHDDAGDARAASATQQHQKAEQQPDVARAANSVAASRPRLAPLLAIANDLDEQRQ